MSTPDMTGQGRVGDTMARPAAAAPARPQPTVASSGGAPRPQRSRRARLTVSRIDPWSVMKLSFLLSIALGVVTLIALSVLWYVLDALGVFTAFDELATDLSPDLRVLDYTGLDRVLGIGMVIAVVNVVLLTALSTLSAFLYNICTSLVGGLHVTLSDES